jgi:hypothetical protein
MLRIRKYIKKPSKWPAVGIVLVMALAMLLAVTTAALALGPISPPLDRGGEGYDLRGGGGNITNVVDVNDAYFLEWTIADASGTGVYEPFLHCDANRCDLHGYSTSAYNDKICKDHGLDEVPPEFDEVGQWTHAVALADLPQVDVGGVICYEMTMDNNQPGGDNELLTLEIMDVYQTHSQFIYPYGNLTSQHRAWSLDTYSTFPTPSVDRYVLFDAKYGAGSGKLDVKIFIPVTIFDPSYEWVVAYMKWGDNLSGYSQYCDHGGFEELGYIIYPCCLDITKGSIDACYPDVDSAEAAAIAATNVTDDCSATAPTVSASTVGTCSAVITVTATDSCDNSLNVTYNTRIDDTPPVLPTLPSGGNLGCNPTLPSCEAVGNATDVCNGQVPVQCAALAPVYGCNTSQKFTYWAVDSCGNNVSANVTYWWTNDTAAPQLPPLPPSSDLGCTNITPSCVAVGNATDVCNGQVPVQCAAGNITGDACNRTQIFTYWAVDLCGNNASANVTYTWKEPQCCVTCETACAAESVGVHTFTGASNWFTYIHYSKGSGNSSSPVTYPIFSGRNQPVQVGTLYVCNNASGLFVKYSNAGAEPGCVVYFSAYHLQVDCSLTALRSAICNQHGDRNPVPGRCEYKGSLNNVPETNWIGANITGCGSTIWIFAHSIACYGCP